MSTEKGVSHPGGAREPSLGSPGKCHASWLQVMTERTNARERRGVLRKSHCLLCSRAEVLKAEEARMKAGALH